MCATTLSGCGRRVPPWVKMVSSPALGWTELETMMGISKATIRTTDKYVIIDATVDGIFRDGFVLYDGNTREHENAALEYLVNSVKVRLCDIDFEDDRVPTEVEKFTSDFIEHRGSRDIAIDVSRPAVDLPELSKFFS